MVGFLADWPPRGKNRQREQAKATMLSRVFLLALLVGRASARRASEVWTREQERSAGIVGQHIVHPVPSEYVKVGDLPDTFT